MRKFWCLLAVAMMVVASAALPSGASETGPNEGSYEVSAEKGGKGGKGKKGKKGGKKGKKGGKKGKKGGKKGKKGVAV